MNEIYDWVPVEYVNQDIEVEENRLFFKSESIELWQHLSDVRGLADMADIGVNKNRVVPLTMGPTGLLGRKRLIRKSHWGVCFWL